MAYRLPGPCDITFDGKVLGTALTGVNIRFKATWSPVASDAFGAAPVGYIFAGQSAVVDCIITESDINRGITQIVESMFPGGILGSMVGDGDDPCKIGETAISSGLTNTLRIDENVSGDYWIADIAFFQDPLEILLASTTELAIPVSFILIPDGNGVLFSTRPYL